MKTNKHWCGPTLFVLVPVILNCLGWSLSMLHQLTASSYAIAGILLAVVFCYCRKPSLNHLATTLKLAKPRYQRRFRRFPPLVYLLAAALILVGGLIHAPTNYDGLTYRLPRMLHWLVAEKWFWIPTINDRMNMSAPAWEWTAFPIFALLKSDRLLFLINAVGFLLMPGLLFSIFRNLGVARRVAWTWMWLLPLSYGYVTQAGSIGNDFTGTMFLLCSIHWGLKARRSGSVWEVWLALWAAGLMSGTKLSNLPLGLPCLIAVWPVLKCLKNNLVASFGALAVAVLVSAVPIMALNQIYSGHWSGDASNESKMKLSNPAAALLGNGILLAEQTFMPPVLPAAQKINHKISTSLPATWDQLLRQEFPRFYSNILNELPTEESAGLGLGITLSLLTGIGVTLLRWAGNLTGLTCGRLHPVVLAGGIALLFYLLKMGSESTARLLLPYYPLCVAAVLTLPGNQRLIRQQLGRTFLVLMSLSILPAMILSAARPLWPGRMICERLQARDPDSALWQRMATVYTTYGHRNDILGPVRQHLPSEAREIGVIAGGNNSIYALWRPFGHRKIIDLRPVAETFLRRPGDLEWVVAKDKEWAEICPIPLPLWAQTNHATIVASVPIVELVGWGPENWTVLRFQRP